MEYLDFILRIRSREDGRFSVRAESPAGQGKAGFTLPEGLEDLQLGAFPSPGAVAEEEGAGVEFGELATRVAEHAAPLRHLVPSGVPRRPAPERLRELGGRLFRAVFQGDVGRLFDRAWGRVEGDPDHGLHLRVQLDPGDRRADLLARIPWELLYREDLGSFLARSRKTPVSRQLEALHRMPALERPERLRILIVAPRPGGDPPLALEAEQRRLTEAVGRLPEVEVAHLEPPTRSELREVLLEQPRNVLHLMGHGDFDLSSGEGFFHLEDGEGGLDRVSARDLEDELTGPPGLGLVVLNACSSGTWSGGSRVHAGLAPALASAGVPAVLAMQAPISDAAALALTRTLYRRLAAGDPLETALVEARLALTRPGSSATGPWAGGEWAIPVLFLHGQGGPLISQALAGREGHREAEEEPGGNPGTEEVATGGARRRSVGLGALLIPTSLITALLVAGLWRAGWVPGEWGPAVPDPGALTQEPLPSGAEAPSTIDPRKLQEPPYRERSARLHLRLPAGGPASTEVPAAGWTDRLERGLGTRLQSLDVDLVHTTRAAWLAVVEMEPPVLGESDIAGRPYATCRIPARVRIFHQRREVATETLDDPVSQMTAERACAVAAERIGERAGAALVEAYLDLDS